MSEVVDTLVTELTYKVTDEGIKKAQGELKRLKEEQDRAAKSLERLEKEQQAVTKTSDDLAEQQLKLRERLAATAEKTTELKEEKRKLAASIDKTKGPTAEQRQRLGEIANALDKATKETRDYRKELSRLGIEQARTRKDGAQLAREQRKVGSASRAAQGDIRKLNGALTKTKGSGFSAQLSSMAAGFTGVALAAAAAQKAVDVFAQIGTKTIEVGAKFEGLRARLKTVEGSSEGAAKAFSLIQDFTRTTPFQLDEVTNAYVRLKSLGLDASQASLTSFGNIAAAQGKSIIDFIEAVADASTGEFERLKEFGIKASKQGEQVTFTFKGQQTVVKNTAADIQGFLKSIGTSDFAGAMADQMATTTGAISNFKDTLEQAFDRIAQQGPLKSFNDLLSTVSNAIAGDDGLGKAIADVLVIALDSARELFEAMPADTLVPFLQSVVTFVGLLAENLVALVSGQLETSTMFYEFATLLFEVGAAIFEVVNKVNEIKESFGGVPGPIDLIIAALKLLLRLMQAWADVIMSALDALDPFLSALQKLAEDIKNVKDTFTGFDNIGETFSALGSAAERFAANIGLINSQLDGTVTSASAASNALDKFYGSMSIQDLTERARTGDERAKAEIGKRAEANDKTIAEQENQAKIERERKEKEKQAAGRMDKSLQQFEGSKIKRASDQTLQALLDDPKVPEKMKKRVRAEQTRREDKRAKAGQKANDKLNKSLLTTEIDKQLDDLAKEAGKRAAARAIQRSGGRLSEEQVNEIELTERQAVKARLARRYEETGQLPPGISQDLKQLGRLPNEADLVGRTQVPVISIQNNRYEIKDNEFAVNLEGQFATSGTEVARMAMGEFRRSLNQLLGEVVPTPEKR